MRKVIYTSIFGENYHLHEPSIKLDGYDFICFTDNPKYQSDIWQARIIPKMYDGIRDSKKPKILPHRYLKDYDISIWIDGDIKVMADIDKLVEEHLTHSNHAVFNHAHCGKQSGGQNQRTCVYQEAEFIKWLGDNNPKKEYKDNIETIFSQVNKYQADGYPANNGLARNTILIRKHNELDVVNAMEMWWEEVKYGSLRDQLSFNYSAWKTDFNFTFIEEDIDNNPWFKLMKKWRQQLNRRKI